MQHVHMDFCLLDDLDDLLPLLPLLEVGDAVVGEEASDSSPAVEAVVADDDFSDLGFFFRFLPSTVVGSSMVVAAMAVRMMSGDDNFISSDSDITLFVCRD